jgi:pimeloyl-ACP methyl ester carboxylesterase
MLCKTKLATATSIALVVTGCANGFPVLNRHALADRIADTVGFQTDAVKTRPFILAARHRLSAPGAPLTVYIEGDGLAWLSRRRLSGDPTPTDPVALRLAAVDPGPNVVHLARPCQYVDDTACHPRYWSSDRFSEEVVSAVNQAIEQFRKRIRAVKVHLVGYSGGGAVAALVAARRKDVASLRTAAGNLDHETLNRYFSVSPLTGSLNPVDYAAVLSHIPQHHFVGREDRVVPVFVADSFAGKVGDKRCVRISAIDGVSHGRGWPEHWREILSLPVACCLP